jgi:hypothetical protein
MPRVSLNRPDLKFDPDDPPSFRCGMWRFGESLGAERVGTTLYEIPPGEAVCPYHYELPAEEWLLVLDGNPTVREPEATTASSRWTSRSLRLARAVRIRSATTAPRRSACSCGERTSTPWRRLTDSNKIGIWTRAGEGASMYRLGTEVDHYDGETGQR